MSKHTSGPWRIGRMAILSDTPIENGPHGCDATEFYGGHLVAESVAACNRPLIAAAPEMLQLLMDLYEEGEVDPCRLNDLIAKATTKDAEVSNG